MKRVLTGSLSALVCGMGMTAVAAVVPTAKQVERQIHAVGVAKAVAQLSADGDVWHGIVDQIATGDRAWLKVAVDLRPGTDAGTSEDLLWAVSHAIQRNPEGALEVMGRGFPESRVCYDREIEPPPEQVKEFKKRTRKALEGVKRADLVARRDACLRVLGGP